MSITVRDLSAVDLFAGVGWDEAARELGIEPLGIDVDADVCATRDVRGLRTLQADVATLDPSEFAPVRLLIGSPPCPTFSGAGRGGGRHLTEIIVRCLGEIAAGNDSRQDRRDEAFAVLEPIYWQAEQAKARKKRRLPDRERSATVARRDATLSLLIVEPLRWVLDLRPELVALEQVPDCLGLWSVTAQLLAAEGYSAWTGVLEAERYGVPQTRERAILMASRVGRVEPPQPTHQRYVPGEPARHEHTLYGELLPWVSMAEALGWDVDCPAPTVTSGGSAAGGAEPFAGGGVRGSDAPVFPARERRGHE